MITVEMIDKVMAETGKDYHEVRAELERNGENVEEAIKNLSEKGKSYSFSYKGKELIITPKDFMDAIKEIWETGSASNLIIEKEGKQVFKFNLLFSGVAALVFIWPVLLGLGVAIIADYNIKIQMSDGREININEVALEKKFREFKEKATNAAENNSKERSATETKEESTEKTMDDIINSMEEMNIKTDDKENNSVDTSKAVDAEYTDDKVNPS